MKKPKYEDVSRQWPFVNGAQLLSSLGPMLSPENRDPKQLADLILLDEAQTLAVLAAGLDDLDESTRAWLLVSAVYNGAPGLTVIASSCSHSAVAAEALATFFALSHMRPWRETAYRVAIAFGMLSSANQRYCQGLIDKIVQPVPPTEWELGALGAAVDGGPEGVIAAFAANATRLGLPKHRIAEFRRCLD